MKINRIDNTPAPAPQIEGVGREPVSAGGWVIRITTVLLIAICFFVAWPSFTRERNVSPGEGDYFSTPLSESDVLSQTFSAAQNRMIALAFYFERDADGAAPEYTDVDIAVRMYREDQDKPLFETTIDSDRIKAYVDTVVETGSLRVGTGTSLRIEMEVLRLGQDGSLAVKTAGVQPTAIHSFVTYRSFDYGAFIACFLLAGVALLLAFDVFTILDRLVARARYIPLFFSPLLVMVTVELLNSLNSDMLLPPLVLLMTYLILLGFTFFFYFLFRRIWLAVLLTDVLWVLFAVINHSKIYFRGDPFFAGDLLVAGEAAASLDNLDFQVSARLLAGILCLAIGLLVFRKKTWRPVGTWKLTAAAAGTAVAVSMFVGLVVCNESVMQDTLKIDGYEWNQMTNYKQNGFVLSFAGSLSKLSIDVPTYDPSEVEGLYTVPDPEADDPSFEEKPNIIVVMSESYSDFRNVRDLPVDQPVMPFFDELVRRENAISGNLLVSVFGGGTANTEFEFLTGGSMLFFPDAVIPYVNYMSRPTHSIPDLLSGQGYRNVAVHPYLRTFYGRESVYPNLGFDDFITMEDFENPYVMRRFISDQSCFERIIREFEVTPDDQRLFMYSVTMQNHFPYYVDEFSPDALDYHVKLNGLTGMDSAELFMSMMRESDDALKYMVEYFEAQDEPVILILFGDHLPGNSQELRPFYNYLFDGEIADLSMEETRKAYETPFFIWSNRDLPEDDIDVISPSLLGPYVLELAGSRQTPYFEYINEVHKSVAAISSKTVVDADGRAYDRSMLTQDIQDLMDRYWIHQYDSVVKDQVGK